LADRSYPAPRLFRDRRRFRFRFQCRSPFRPLSPDPLRGLPWFLYLSRSRRVPKSELLMERQVQAPERAASAAVSQSLLEFPAEAAEQRLRQRQASDDSA
jgi:hypothetical protein